MMGLLTTAVYLFAWFAGAKLTTALIWRFGHKFTLGDNPPKYTLSLPMFGTSYKRNQYDWDRVHNAYTPHQLARLNIFLWPIALLHFVFYRKPTDRFLEPGVGFWTAFGLVLDKGAKFILPKGVE